MALEDGACTVGYNVPPFKSPFTPKGLASSAYQVPEDCVVIRNAVRGQGAFTRQHTATPPGAAITL